MGYTHYWYRPKKLNPDIFKAAMVEVREALDCYEKILGGWDGKGVPYETGDYFVRFNGIGDDAHETFYVHRAFKKAYKSQTPMDNGLWFAFCKTAAKPYDMPVMICLIIFNHWFGDNFHVWSDGDMGDWKPAMAWCHKKFGYGKEFKLREDGDA